MKYRADDVLDAAIEVVAVDGVGVSTARIARASGISNGTLFNYFPTKQALLDAMYLRIKRQLGHAVGDVDRTLSLRDQARRIWDRWIEWAVRHPSAWRVSRLLAGADLVSPAVMDQSLTALAGPMSVLPQMDAHAEAAGLPPGYAAALVQAHLDVAIEHRLTGAERDAAFTVMWQGITSATPSNTLEPTGAPS